MPDRPPPRKPNRKPAKAPTAAPAAAAQPAATTETAPKSRLVARIGAMLGGKATDGPKQFLQGRLTYLGVLLTAAGTVGKLFGWYVPVDEIKSAIDFVQAQWPVVMEFVGMVTTIYGRFRIGKR